MKLKSLMVAVIVLTPIAFTSCAGTEDRVDKRQDHRNDRQDGRQDHRESRQEARQDRW